MAIIDPLALATKGIIAKTTRIDALGLATKGILVIDVGAPPAALPAVWRMWTGGIGIDMYGRYDRG